MNWRKIILTLLILLLLAGGIASYIYKIIYGSNVETNEPIEFYISGDDSIDNVLSNLKSNNVFSDHKFLDLIADKMSFTTSKPKPGRYTFNSGMSTYDVLNKLRLGIQTPIMLTIQGMRTIEDLAGFLGRELQHDSLHYLERIRTNPDKSLCNFLPDTYELYWSTTGNQFKDRMATYHKKFWQDKPRKISGIDMSPCEVYILASIVEKETSYDPEKADVAGVYINRLKRGMPLQADPTVIFSIGDFSIRRVLTRYLSFDSPYNTYLHTGLPPGPICMPSKSSIMAVLNAKKHDYIYFCAKADNSGTHAFAETLAQHNRNARAFQRWMNQRGIRR